MNIIKLYNDQYSMIMDYPNNRINCIHKWIMNPFREYYSARYINKNMFGFKLIIFNKK